MDDSAIRVKDKIPYSREGDGPIQALKTILTQFSRVQKITFSVALPFIQFERLASREELAAKGPEEPIGKRIYEAVRGLLEVQEYSPESAKSPCDQLFEVFELVADEGLVVSQLLVDAPASLRKWIKISRRRDAVFDVPFYAVPALPAKTLLVCGSFTKDAGPEDVQVVFKINMD